MPVAGDSPSQGLKNFHSNPKSSTNASPTFAPIKGNEKDRLVRCRTCGFPCDMERDVKSVEGTWAGLGIDQGSQLTANASPLSDGRTLSAAGGAQNADRYYSRTVVGGCPNCGDFLYYLNKED